MGTSAMPGMQPDIDHRLQDGDRVSFPPQLDVAFQYRFGVPMVDEMSNASTERKTRARHHAYDGVRS
jgi:hypothetical protein